MRVFRSCLAQGLIYFSILTFSKCAVLDENNRYLTNVLEETAPESEVAQVAFAPVAFVLGLSSLLVDGVLIHPLVSLPYAIENGTWVFTEIGFLGPLEIIATPMRIITFPVIVIGSEILRITLPFDMKD